YHDCETALLYWTGPFVLSQGDFAPWNIRNLGSQLFVTDWGHAHADASPLDDVLHYLMIQRALNFRPVTVPVLRQAMSRAAEFAVQAYPEWTWRAPVIGALTLVYLLGVVLHRSLARRRIDRSDRVVGAYWKWLELLCQALDHFPGAEIELLGELAGVDAQHPQLTLGGALEVDALQARLERAAYLVLPACNGEPLPRALIDAFANGLAVIAPEE